MVITMVRTFERTKKSVVEIRCGLDREWWTSRQEAIDFYMEGALCCDGSEAERYMDIVGQLMAGYEICSDGMEPKGGWKD